MKNSLFIISALLATFTQPVLAHAGHDHSSPMSTLLHIFFYVSMVISAGVIAFSLIKMWKVKNQPSKEPK